MRPVLVAVLALLPAMAAADPVPVRAGDHAGRGRLVFDWAAAPGYRLDRDGERVLLHFPPGTALSLPKRLPRNVVGLTPTEAGLSIQLKPGAALRHYRLRDRVVVDVLDPPKGMARGPGRASTAEAEAPVDEAVAPRKERSARSGRANRGGALPAAVPPGSASAADTVSNAGPAASPPSPPASASDPAKTEAAGAPPPRSPAPAIGQPAMEVGTASARAATPARQGPRAQLRRSADRSLSVLLPSAPGTGAAILRRGDEMLVILDRDEAPDLAGLRGDPVFGAMAAEALPGALLLRLPLAPSARLQARRETAGWVLEAGRSDAARQVTRSPAVLDMEAGPSPRLLLRVAAPGRSVAITDPETGLPLLVGTLREGGEAVLVGRRLPQFDVPETELGVAILARSDTLALQPGTDRFSVTATGGGRLALDPGVLQAGTAGLMTRSFDLPNRPASDLMARLRGLQAGIANAPPLGRMDQRRAAGEALLALGLPQEAQAMLRLGFAEDPRAAADPGYAALAAAAALLAGRLSESGALLAPDLPGSDEATLWRAALAASGSDWRAAGPGFAATLPLLLGYPSALKARLLPLAGLALAEAGEVAALKRLLAEAGEESDALTLPRAILAEVEGKAEEALAGYDRAIAGRDRLARARAIRRAVDLRLASGRIDAGQAARALEAALFAWRGDASEIETRLRLAALRREAGDGRGALALLRETAAMAPEKAEALELPMRDAFFAALAELPPLAAVTLYETYPELLPADSRGEQALQLLAGRLLELDLGDRAAALLRVAMERGSGVPRAALGLHLATLRLGERDAAGALSALADSAATDLPPELARERTILAARAEARRGRQAEAVAALRALGAPGGDALSEVLAESADWPGSAAALTSFLDATLPPAPAPLEPPQRRLVLRQAALMALAGDESALAALRAAQAARMGEGPLAEAFGLLTADPLRGVADLPRLQRELQLFRTLPARLEALRAGAPLTR